MSMTRFDRLAPLEPGADEPLYRQLYDRFRHAISTGVLKPGDRIPSTRALTRELGLARGTIEAAYALLAAEGYVQPRGQAGTVVTPGLALPVPPPDPVPPMLDSEQTFPAPLPLRPPSIVPLQMGLPALDAFPRKIWARLGARHWRAAQADDMAYPAAAGLPLLRSEIAAYLQVSRGIACSPEQVFVTAGYRQTLAMILRALFQTSQRVWLEDPGYPPTVDVLRAARMDAVSVPVDQDGVVVSAGIEAAADAKGVIVTPAHQSPLGVSLSLPRRLALLDWATRAGAWIIEDDYDGEFRYVGRPLPALKSLDHSGRVLYAGSFSKVLFPGLRLAYVVVPESEIETFRRVSQIFGGDPPHHSQAVVTDFIKQGHFGRHIQRMRKLYGERRSTTVAAFEAVLGGQVRIAPQPGGMHLVAYLNAPLQDTVIADRLWASGLYAQALSRWSRTGRGESALLLSFTNVASRDEAVRLARRIRELL